MTEIAEPQVPLITPRGVHHTGFVVSSLTQSIEFYTTAFGAQLEVVIEDVGDDSVAELHGLPAVRFDLAFLALGGARLELFEFAPSFRGAEDIRVRANDLGAAHIALHVDDVHAAYRALTAAGIRFSRPPLTLEHGPGAGHVLAFCFDPDGNRIELLQPPQS